MTRNDSLVGIIEKNRTEQVRVTFAEYGGQLYLDVRIFTSMPPDGDYCPTKKGICIKLSDVRRLRSLLDRAVKLGAVEKDRK